MKTKDQEIKEIETQQRELADRLAKLQKPKRKPQAGDVWMDNPSGRVFLVDDMGASDLGLDEAGVVVRMANHVTFDEGECIYLGKTKDVLMLRSEAQKEEDDLRQKLLDWRDRDGDGILGNQEPYDCELIAFLKDLLGGS